MSGSGAFADPASASGGGAASRNRRISPIRSKKLKGSRRSSSSGVPRPLHSDVFRRWTWERLRGVPTSVCRELYPQERLETEVA